MQQGSANSFFKFVFGFMVFIAVSFGVTYAAATYSVAQERERQVGAAFQAMLGAQERTWTDALEASFVRLLDKLPR